MVTLILGLCRGPEEIGAAPGLREALRGKALAPEQRLHKALLLGIGAVQDDGVADKLRPHAEDTGKLVAERPDLLHEQAGGDPIHAPAAPLHRVAAPQEISPSRLLEKLLRELDRIRVHVEDHLPGDPLHEVPRLVPDPPLLFRQQKVIHSLLSSLPGDASQPLLSATIRGQKKGAVVGPPLVSLEVKKR